MLSRCLYALTGVTRPWCIGWRASCGRVAFYRACMAAVCCLGATTHWCSPVVMVQCANCSAHFLSHCSSSSLVFAVVSRFFSPPASKSTHQQANQISSNTPDQYTECTVDWTCRRSVSTASSSTQHAALASGNQWAPRDLRAHSFFSVLTATVRSGLSPRTHSLDDLFVYQ